MKQNPQVSATVTPELWEQLQELSQKEGRSISNMASILLQAAVNERNRKKKKKPNGLQSGQD